MKQLILGLVAALLIAASPAPTGHLNDFANIIPDDKEAVLEHSLQGYEKQTSIEIAVVTTPSLEGREIEDYSIDLAREWGVGKRGADNGVLIVIAPNERKYRIEVGYGLEGDLTDADSSTIARDTLVAAFKANDYAGGIERLTQALTAHLGTMTPEQRADFHRKIEEAAKQRAQAQKADFFSFMGWVLGVLLIIAVLAIIFYTVRSLIRTYRTWVRNKERRETLLKYVADTDSVPDTLIAEVRAINLPHLPVWMQDDKERYSLALEEALEKAGQIRKEMESLISVDLDQAESLKYSFEVAIQRAEGYLEKLRSIPEGVQIVRDVCEAVVARVATEIDDLIKLVGALEKGKYRVKDLVPALDIGRLAEEKQSITTLFSNRGEGPLDASESVHDKATRLQKKVSSLKHQLDSVIQTESASRRRIEVLQGRIDTFPALLHGHRTRLERLEAMAPRSRFNSFKEGLPVFERTLSGIAPRVKAAIKDNSLELQLFTDAAKILDAAEASLRTVDATVQEAKELESAITAAKEQYSTKLENAKRAVTKAQRVTSDSDVRSAAKSRLQEAQRILKSINIEATPTDWIAVSDLLAQATAKANQATQLAQSDIDSAERERRRKREEEERRQRRAREASTASQTNFGGGGFGGGGSSGGGFGGFGGGSFGGGGSSGGW